MQTHLVTKLSTDVFHLWGSQISEEYALSATRSQESCYMLFYVRADGAGSGGGDKENVPANQRADANDPNNQSNGNEAVAGSELRAFL